MVASAPSAQSTLEHALVALRRAALAMANDAEPAIDFRPAARALEGAESALFDVIRGVAEPSGATTSALSELQSALGALGPSQTGTIGLARACVSEAQAHIGKAQEELLRAPPRQAAPVAEIRASEGLPHLHALERASIVLAIRVIVPPLRPAPPPVPPPKPRTIAELKQAIEALKAQNPPAQSVNLVNAEVQAPAPARAPIAGFSSPLPPVLDDATFRRQRVRECFEEIAMVAVQRAPLPSDDWRASLGLEMRLLRALDWIAALGPLALEHVLALYRSAPVADGPHAFALTLVLGCFSGRDTLFALETLFLLAERDAELLRGFAEAFSLVPHDDMHVAMRGLLREPEPSVRALSLGVLGRRGALTEAEALLGTRDSDARVVRAAWEELQWFGGPNVIARIDELLASENKAEHPLCFGAMTLSGHPRARRVLLDALPGESGELAALWLAIGGDEGDALSVLHRLEKQPKPGFFDSVAISGLGASIAVLVRLLSHEDEEVAANAARALERITGAGLVESVEVPEEELLGPEPPPTKEPALGGPKPSLQSEVSDSRDLPPSPAVEKIERPATNRDAWQSWLRASGFVVEPSIRYRRGKPFTPLVALAELGGPLCSPKERALLVAELVARTGELVRMSVSDWVRAQEKALGDWEPIARRASNSPGAFVRPPRR